MIIFHKRRLKGKEKKNEKKVISDRKTSKNYLLMLHPSVLSTTMTKVVIVVPYVPTSFALTIYIYMLFSFFFKEEVNKKPR